jgi:hypothetical protein
MDAVCSSETSILTGLTGRQISEDDILQSHRREDFKSYAMIHHNIHIYVKLSAGVSELRDTMTP